MCAVPALRALRYAMPEAEIVLLGLPWAQGFVERFNEYLDGFREFPGYPGLPERFLEVAKFPQFLEQIQAERFDLALQMQGSGGVTNPLTLLLGARQVAGFYRPGEFCPDPGRFLAYPDQDPEIRRLLRLVEFLGAVPQGEDLEFPLTDQDWADFSALPGNAMLSSQEYVCLHPGASHPRKCWAIEAFIQVARGLQERGLLVVLTGTTAEAERTQKIHQALSRPCLDLAGKTSLGSLGALLQGARLLICNDTGVSHIACALRVPSVILFSKENAQRWAPLHTRLHRVLFRADDLGPFQVLQQVDDLLLSSSKTTA